MSKSKLYVSAIASVIAGAIITSAPAGAVASSAPQATQITMCHATGFATFPYTAIYISSASVDEAGGHYLGGHGSDSADIIPSFTSPKGTVYPGKNMTDASKAILHAGCVVKAVPTTPAPTTPTTPPATPTTPAPAPTTPTTPPANQNQHAPAQTTPAPTTHSGQTGAVQGVSTTAAETPVTTQVGTITPVAAHTSELPRTGIREGAAVGVAVASAAAVTAAVYAITRRFRASS